MISLTRFAGIARQYGVPFQVEFTAHASYVVIGGSMDSWRATDTDSQFIRALGSAGAIRDTTCGDKEHEMWFQLESLT